MVWLLVIITACVISAIASIISLVCSVNDRKNMQYHIKQQLESLKALGRKEDEEFKNELLCNNITINIYTLLKPYLIQNDTFVDYEGNISELGDVVIMHKHDYSGSVRGLRKTICLEVNNLFPSYLIRQKNEMEIAEEMVYKILQYTPPPWKAFAGKVSHRDGMLRFIYGVA
jgi:hypothetical protein